MTQQSADITLTVVQDPFTAFVGALLRFWQTQDPYSFMLGIAIGLSMMLVFLIIHLNKKS